MDRHKKEIDEVVFWINRALLASNFYRGECVRRLKISEKELNYYSFGKVFRFQNITSASIISKDNPKNSYVYGGTDYNVEIHIFST